MIDIDAKVSPVTRRRFDATDRMQQMSCEEQAKFDRFFLWP
jgi:hypothetical protein